MKGVELKRTKSTFGNNVRQDLNNAFRRRGLHAIRVIMIKIEEKLKILRYNRK